MRPKVKALGLLVGAKGILVEVYHGQHSKGSGDYYRPIGGNIEIGELSNDTVVREYKEEIGLDVKGNKYITCIENIFEMNNEIGHEVIQVYSVSFRDETCYEREEYPFVDGHNATARWLSMKDAESGKVDLYPNGLADVLKKL
ncbi:MAG: NUDIX domain-containing protein [Anaerobacillus sp.]